MYEKQIKAPYVPVVKSADDTGNFYSNIDQDDDDMMVKSIDPKKDPFLTW